MHDEEDHPLVGPPTEAARPSPPRGRCIATSLLGAAALLVCAGALAAAARSRGWLAGDVPSHAAGASFDATAALASDLREGVRYVPPGVDARAATCAPSGDAETPAPGRPTARIEQRALDARAARGLRAPPADPDSSACAVRMGTRAMLFVRNACLRDGTLFLRTSADRPPLSVWNASFGPADHPHVTRVQLAEWSTAEHAPPGPYHWVGGVWLALSPRFRFGTRNLFHALTESIHYLDAVARAARVAANETRALLVQPRDMLHDDVTGKLWALANGPRQAFHVARGVTVCFADLRMDVAHDGARAAEGGACSRAPMEQPRAASSEGVDLVGAARRALGLPPAPREVGGLWPRPRITVVHRLKTRRIANLGFLTAALKALGADVTVASFECVPIEVQLALVSNSSTLIGVHGAGLALGKFLPHDGAILELRSAPCATADRSSMRFRSRYRVLGAPRAATVPRAECPLWKAKASFDAVVDVEAVLGAVNSLDAIVGAQRGGSGSAGSGGEHGSGEHQRPVAAAPRALRRTGSGGGMSMAGRVSNQQQPRRQVLRALRRA